MSMHQIRLYDLFRKELCLPDDKAAAFVRAVEKAVNGEIVSEKHLPATKDDFGILKNDVNLLKNDINFLKGDVNILKSDIHRMELKIEQSKTDIYKGIFLSGIVQLLAILGAVMAIVKWMK